uniref:BZIP domain-containing protein n=1 Tax=Kalanchoe fedtschenkoi TaxID=63787 RepID=A0A7N0R9W7_KALFE
MEEVWKDITTLSSSSHHHLPATGAAHHHSSLHEFLASPVVYPPTQTCDPGLPSWSASQASKPRFRKLDDHHGRPSHSQQLCGGCPCSQSSPTPSSVFASSLFPPLCPQKRESEDDNACGDRRYKRKMKNRESATRSRARRQAYTNELEIEIAHLKEENALLRRQQKEICSAAAAAAAVAHQPKKSTLIRTLSAPF